MDKQHWLIIELSRSKPIWSLNYTDRKIITEILLSDVVSMLSHWCLRPDWSLRAPLSLLCHHQTHPHRGTEAHQWHFTLQIRGKDLVGGVKVMPMGLDAAIKKRTSGEFSMEVNWEETLTHSLTHSPSYAHVVIDTNSNIFTK